MSIAEIDAEGEGENAGDGNDGIPGRGKGGRKSMFTERGLPVGRVAMSTVADDETKKGKTGGKGARMCAENKTKKAGRQGGANKKKRRGGAAAKESAPVATFGGGAEEGGSSDSTTSGGSTAATAVTAATAATGRWTTSEHNLFLKGFETCGKDWKKVTDIVQTRTIVQVRTHAQKYLVKMAKAHFGESGAKGGTFPGSDTSTSLRTAGSGRGGKGRGGGASGESRGGFHGATSIAFDSSRGKGAGRNAATGSKRKKTQKGARSTSGGSGGSGGGGRGGSKAVRESKTQVRTVCGRRTCDTEY
jgi:SHAQKYF class myb-like DNA-binding protein